MSLWSFVLRFVSLPMTRWFDKAEKLRKSFENKSYQRVSVVKRRQRQLSVLHAIRLRLRVKFVTVKGNWLNKLIVPIHVVINALLNWVCDAKVNQESRHLLSWLSKGKRKEKFSNQRKKKTFLLMFDCVDFDGSSFKQISSFKWPRKIECLE